MAVPNLQTGQNGFTPSSGNSGAGINVSGAHAALIAILIEMGGLVIVVAIAGVNEDVGSLILLIMFGILLLMLVMHSGQLANTMSFITKKEQG